jgi:hypothetical protein
MRRLTTTIAALVAAALLLATALPGVAGDSKKPSTKPAKTKTTKPAKTTPAKTTTTKTTTIKTTTTPKTTTTNKTNTLNTHHVTTAHRLHGVPRWAQHHRFYRVYARSMHSGRRNFATHPQAHQFARSVRHMGIPARVVHLSNNAWQVRFGHSHHWHLVRSTINSSSAHATAQLYRSRGFQASVHSHWMR